MTSGNVSDEPIAHEDADALERLAGIADLVLFHDRPIQTRTDDSVLRAVPGRRPLLMRRSRGFVPDSLALPVRRAPRRARVRGRAQEHVLRRQGRAGVGRPPHRRPQDVRGAAGLRGGDRALRAAVRGRARGGRPRRAPRLPLDPVRARPRGRRGRRGPAPPRPPRRLPRRARRDRPGGRRDLRRHRLRERRHGLGRRAAGRRPRRLRARRAPVARAPAGRRPRGAPAVADGRARGCSRRAGTGRCPGRTRGAPSRSPSSCAAGSPRR